MTAAELAAKLNVNVKTVFKMCRTHQWPHSQTGRLYRSTEGHHQISIATPERPDVKLRTQRENIARLLRSAPNGGV